MKGFIITGIFFCVTWACMAQVINVARLDSLVEAISSRGLGMGSLVISKNDKVQYQKAFGYAYLSTDQKIHANLQTKYRIGSISKLFTATMIFQLVEEGKLNLDTRLNHFFPELPNAGKIAIANLLYHRSGLHDYTHDTNFENWMDKPRSHEELLDLIKDKGTDFEPGTKADYCNTNYLLLGYIIEKVTQTDYAAALRERISEKLGLHRTAVGGAIDIKKNEAASYKFAEGQWKSQKETDLSIHGGAGSIVSTAPEMIQFIEALFSHKLVNEGSLGRMKTMVDGYGMGMFPDLYGSKTSFGHNGKIEEFSSALWYFPSDKLSIAYVTNGVVYPRDDFMEVLLKICFREKLEIPFSNQVILKSTDLGSYAGEYTSPQLPFTVVCSAENDALLFDANGKKFQAEAVSKDYFMHRISGTFFEFHPGKQELLIKEGYNVYYLKRLKP